MKIAVIRNRKMSGVLGKLGRPCKERYGRRSVQSVMNALRSIGHSVKVFEGDINMFSNLSELFHKNPDTGMLDGMVFNMAYGIQGEARYTHIPAMLEMAGVPYTGPGPQGHAISLDKALTKLLMERNGIPTPKFLLFREKTDLPKGLHYPLVVKPRYESTSLGLQLVSEPDQLAQAVERVLTEFQQEALVEEYIDGREVAVGLLGNDPVEVLPMVEIKFRDRELKIITKPDKFHRTDVEPKKICPAPVHSELTSKLQDIAVSVYKMCQCRDYARLDIRLDKNGNPFVLEINSMATLGQKGGFVLAAHTAGYNFKQLVCRILDVAHIRYFGHPAPKGIDPKLLQFPHPAASNHRLIMQRSIPRMQISTKTINGEVGRSIND